MYAPVAQAGPDQQVFVGYQVQLNGGASHDIDGDALTYQWAFIEIPAGSNAAISAPDISSPTFIVDAPGNYKVQLVVSDSQAQSPADEILISTEIIAREITQFIVAQLGGTIYHPDGATLIIPAGALSQDADVSIERVGYSGIEPHVGMLPLTYTFSVDLGGAEVITPLELRLKLAGAIQSDDVSPAPMVSLRVAMPLITENLLLKTQKPDGPTWLRTIELDPATQEAVYHIGEEMNLYDLPLGPTFEIDQIPDVEIWDPPNILSVPFYYQSRHPWCVPTSLAMLLNFHETELGRISNWTIAARSSQDWANGNWPEPALINAGMEPDEFESAIWDADLIPANPFADFIRLQTQGYYLPGLYGGILAMDLNGTWVVVPVPAQYQPPRPINIVANELRHAFLGVGANSHSIWIHDPNGDIAIEESWEVFREDVIDVMETDELSTVVINAPERPETERRGSIVLSRPEGLMLKDHRYDPSVNTLYFEWDGDPYEYGYFWNSDQDTFLDSTLFENSLALNEEGYLPAYLEHDPKVANVTAEQRQYILDIDIVDDAGTEYNSRSIPVTVPAYSWHAIDNNTWGQLDIDTIVQPGVYQIVLSLYHEDVLQDTKTVQFQVVQNDYPNIIASAVPISGDVPLSVQFTGNVSGGLEPYSFTWYFGDNWAVYNEQSPLHTYEMPGEYTAEVTLTDALGDVSRSQVVITAYPENEPVLAVKPIYIDFGAMLPGTGASKTIHIKNEGELPLEINHISYGGDYVFEVGIPSIPLTIAPWDERIITVDFFPNIRGYYSGMISIVSNDPHNPNALVGIEGHVVDLLSILTVSPGFLLFDDGTLEQTITIGNDGNTGLSWAIVDDLPAWLTTSPREGFVHWFSPSEITVSADPTGLAEGVYTHNLQVASSGGDALVLVVLEVEAAPPPPPVLSFTAPYYSHGWVYAKRGYVSDQGIADPGPYGETSESDLHGPSETVLAYGFRGWCYPGEIGCQCDFPTLFNFPGDHPINMAGPACSPTYAGWMSSWAGLHADPLIGEISILAGGHEPGWADTELLHSLWRWSDMLSTACPMGWD